jgi:hypothetical protein
LDEPELHLSSDAVVSDLGGCGRERAIRPMYHEVLAEIRVLLAA